MQLVSGALDSLRPRVKLLDSRLPNRSKCGEAVSRTNRQNIVWNCCFLYSAGFLVFWVVAEEEEVEESKGCPTKEVENHFVSCIALQLL